MCSKTQAVTEQLAGFCRTRADLLDTECFIFIPRPNSCCEGRDPTPNFHMCSGSATSNKRPAAKQGPDLYFEPKWLWCWHCLRCTLHYTLHSMISMKKCC